MPADSPIACLMGPTASGKSGIALRLAEHFPIEIVSVDSALVYRSMDIGTAKPSARERDQVAHHLIDLIDPSESYSAARFCADSLAAVADIRARGRIPLLVGGTMLYFKALREGLDELPVADAVTRAQLDREAQERGWPALHGELARVDAVTAARLAPNDAQRIQRALEVYRLTGRALSELQRPEVPRTGPRFSALALEPSDRALLHARIETRLDAMFEAGFVEEVRSLRQRGDLHLNLPSMRCVGYRQVWHYLDGSIHGLEMRAQALAATRQLAKRQLTWLRALPERQVVDCFSPHAFDHVRDWLSRAHDS